MYSCPWTYNVQRFGSFTFFLPFSPTCPSRQGRSSSCDVHLIIYLFISIFVPFPCPFLKGLSLALRSHDKFQASHWSTMSSPPPSGWRQNTLSLVEFVSSILKKAKVIWFFHVILDHLSLHLYFSWYLLWYPYALWNPFILFQWLSYIK